MKILSGAPVNNCCMPDDDISTKIPSPSQFRFHLFVFVLVEEVWDLDWRTRRCIHLSFADFRLEKLGTFGVSVCSNNHSWRPYIMLMKFNLLRSLFSISTRVMIFFNSYSIVYIVNSYCQTILDGGRHRVKNESFIIIHGDWPYKLYKSLHYI